MVPVKGHAISSRAYSAALAPLRKTSNWPSALSNAAGQFSSLMADSWHLKPGEGGIRTHDEIAPILVFETSALSLSATSPQRRIIAPVPGPALRRGPPSRVLRPAQEERIFGRPFVVSLSNHGRGTESENETARVYPPSGRDGISDFFGLCYNRGNTNSRMATAKPSSSTEGAT